MPITHFSDTDLYKFTMGQGILHQYSEVRTKFYFKNRSSVDLTPYCDRINEALDTLSDVKMSKDEEDYLRHISYIKSDAVDFWRNVRFRRDDIRCYINKAHDKSTSDELRIETNGLWRDDSWFEIPVLALIQEMYMDDHLQPENFAIGRKNLHDRIEKFNKLGEKYPFTVSEFGTRRRASFAWHDYVVKTLKSDMNPKIFVGTSNVFLAMKYGIRPIGTFAHEWYQGIMGTGVNITSVQKKALDSWANEFRGDLGIALSDILGFDYFLKDFDKYFAKLFDGCRHDSGDPIIWGNMLIEHYKKLGIDPRTRSAVWSDQIDVDTAEEILQHFAGKIHVGFGIGTNLVNDLGVKALQMVIKLAYSNGQPTIKCPDSEGKIMCPEPWFANYVTKMINFETIGNAVNENG